MKFRRVFRGYSPRQVDDFVEELQKKESALRATQKQRIDELSDENYTLRKQLEKYRTDSDAIATAMIQSQKTAKETLSEAEKFSQLTLLRAKTFYCAWHAFAQTFVASLSDEEVKRFNSLKRRLEQTINAYDGENVALFSDEVQKNVGNQSCNRQNAEQSDGDVKKEAVGNLQNPLQKLKSFVDGVESQQPKQVIDLQELTKTEESLADLCQSLGLNAKNGNVQK